MSNTKCCVPGCNNSKGSLDTLHKFPNPAKYESLFNMWVHCIGGPVSELQNDFIWKYRRVCDLHFEEKFKCRNNRLSNIAVPTLRMPTVLATLPAQQQGEAADEDTQLGQNLEVLAGLPPQQLGETAGQEQMKENLEPTTMRSNLAPVTGQFHENAAQNVSMTRKQEHFLMSTTEIAHDKRRPFKIIQSTSGTSNAEVVHKKAVAVTHTAHKRKYRPATETEHALHKRLVRLGVKLSKYRSMNRKQAVKLKALQNISTNPQFLKTIDNLSSTAKILTLMQFRECKKKNKGRRFTTKEKILALSIMKQSPKGYRFLRKIFVLPAPQTLLKLLHLVDIKPGVNKNVIKQIEEATKNMKIADRLCVVIFDEMSLAANVTYNERKDKVVGFVNNGQQTRAEYADHAQVFMVRGLLKNYKQPVSYTFSQAATKGPELAVQLKEVISQLQAAGLIVVATICDQGTNNVQCYKLLVQERHATLLRIGEEPKGNTFTVNGQEIVPLYDPPHMMKCIRNNLITKDLKYKIKNLDKIAKWKHIQQLHDENPGYQGIRLVPKLTDNHVIPSKISKMKVKYATQIFSQTIATNMGYLADKGILSSECRDTADILLFFDRLFDSLNGSYAKKTKHGKPLLGPATPNSIHHKVWQESKKMLKEMSFINITTGQAERVPTLNNWIWTIEGIEKLLGSLKEKFDITSVWLRHLNQDPIENFFGAIRSHGCRNVNPTPERFESAFTTLLVNSLSNVHAPGANCEEDQCFILSELIINSGCKALPVSEQTISEIDEIPDIAVTSLENKTDPREIGGLQYVSGYFIKKTKTKVFKGCSQCNNDLIAKKQHEYIKYREYAGKHWLCNPSNSLLECVSMLQDVNYAVIKTNLDKKNLKEMIKTWIFATADFSFIKCSKHKDQVIDYLINLSCRFFIYNYCKDINKILKNKRESDDDNDKFKFMAKKYFHKCYKRKNK